MDHTVVHFEIPADDPERAAKFYRDLFGWDIKQYEGTAAGGIDYWMVKTVPTDSGGMPVRPGVNGGLMRRMFPGQAPVNYIAVDDVEKFIRKAERAGAKVLMGKHPVPGMGWFAQFTDPEGNVFAIWQTDPKAAQTGEQVTEEVADARR
jgi:predicted enzyme related to lactoylglutathione lyase